MATKTVQVGTREFRENLSRHVLKSDGPFAIMRHGDMVGYYLAVHRKRTEAERAAFKDAADKLQAVLDEKGLTEDKLIADYERMNGRC